MEGHQNHDELIDNAPSTQNALIELIEKIRQDYPDAIDTNRAFGLMSKGQEVPSLEHVLQIFTDEKLKVVKDFRSAALVLIPPAYKLIDDLRAFDNRPWCQNPRVPTRYPGGVLIDAFEWSYLWEEREEWGAYLVESSPSYFSSHDDRFDPYSINLQTANKIFRSYLADYPFIQGMNPAKYVQLMMRAKKHDLILDYRGCFTILDETYQKSNLGEWPNHIHVAGWESHPSDFRDHFMFKAVHPRQELVNFGYRRSTGGPIKKV